MRFVERLYARVVPDGGRDHALAVYGAWNLAPEPGLVGEVGVDDEIGGLVSLPRGDDDQDRPVLAVVVSNIVPSSVNRQSLKKSCEPAGRMMRVRIF